MSSLISLIPEQPTASDRAAEILSAASAVISGITAVLLMTAALAL